MKRLELLKSLFVEKGKADDTKFIALFGTFFGALILAYAVYQKLDDIWLMFMVFMGATCGLKVSKGIITTQQQRNNCDERENEQ